MTNGQAEWDQFDPEKYLDANYIHLRPDDACIIDRFIDFIQTVPGSVLFADIGSGPNLYPALFMTGRAQSISLIEYATSNLAWLTHNLEGNEAPKIWWPYVRHAKICSDMDEYRLLWKQFRATAMVSQGSIFTLPKAAWDFATMFFVAESLTDDRDEFIQAFRSYLESIRPGGWCFAAFMEGSVGYTVGTMRYPAVSIHIPDIEKIAQQYCSSASFDRLPLEEAPVRPGYSGMILFKGRIGAS